MDTNKNKDLALQILYFLEDRGIQAEYSDWGEVAYYSFNDLRDYQNAYYLLTSYCGPEAVKDCDSNRLEIRVDVSSAWTKLKEALDEDDEDAVTEALLNDDMVEDDLTEGVHYATAPKELQDKFEDGMKTLGWLPDENTKHGNKYEYNSWFDSVDNEDDAKSIHYQYVSKDAFENESDLQEVMNATFDFIDELESDYNCRILFSGGLITDEKLKNHESLALDIKPIKYRDDEGPTPEYGGQKLYLNKGKPVRDSDKALVKDIGDHMNMNDDEVLSNFKNEDYDELDETYSKDELDKFRNKVFNQQKVMSIYRKKKYGQKRLMCRTKCVNCGREKKLFLSNLVTNPEKYGSCVCSDTNIDARMDTITGLYRGTKILKSNTSGYTGVSWVAKYRGEPYNKWRAYIDIDGKRNYLGDFNSKSKAIRARKAAAKKGLKWYNDNKNQFMATSRRKHKRTRRQNLKKTE